MDEKLSGRKNFGRAISHVLIFFLSLISGIHELYWHIKFKDPVFREIFGKLMQAWLMAIFCFDSCVFIISIAKIFEDNGIWGRFHNYPLLIVLFWGSIHIIVSIFLFFDNKESKIRLTKWYLTSNSESQTVNNFFTQSHCFESIEQTCWMYVEKRISDIITKPSSLFIVLSILDFGTCIITYL